MNYHMNYQEILNNTPTDCFAITCYGDTQVYPKSQRKKMINEYISYMGISDGSEQNRYACIVSGLNAGEKYVFDDFDEQMDFNKYWKTTTINEFLNEWDNRKLVDFTTGYLSSVSINYFKSEVKPTYSMFSDELDDYVYIEGDPIYDEEVVEYFEFDYDPESISSTRKLVNMLDNRTDWEKVDEALIVEEQKELDLLEKEEQEYMINRNSKGER